MKPTRLTRAAQAEFAAIRREGVREWGKERSDRYIDAIVDRLNSAGAHPDRHPLAQGLGKGVRRVRSGHHIVFYREEPDHILILRILHEKQDHPAHLNPRP